MQPSKRKIKKMGNPLLEDMWQNTLQFCFSFIRTHFKNDFLNNSNPIFQFSSVQFSHSVVSVFLWPHGLQYARPPCPSRTPRVYLNSCDLSQRCHLTISSSVIPFSSHLQSFPASGSFQMSQLFTSGGQSIGVSASKSVISSNELSGLIFFRMDWFDPCLHSS